MHLTHNVKELKINLPTGETLVISHIGHVELKNGLRLNNVLYIPSFKQNLLSVQKLTEDGGLKVGFHPGFCVIQYGKTGKVKGLGEGAHGLYFLIDLPLSELEKCVNTKEINSVTFKAARKGETCAMHAENMMEIAVIVRNVTKSSEASLWHRRLGHGPL